MQGEAHAEAHEALHRLWDVEDGLRQDLALAVYDSVRSALRSLCPSFSRFAPARALSARLLCAACLQMTPVVLARRPTVSEVEARTYVCVERIVEAFGEALTSLEAESASVETLDKEFLSTFIAAVKASLLTFCLSSRGPAF